MKNPIKNLMLKSNAKSAQQSVSNEEATLSSHGKNIDTLAEEERAFRATDEDLLSDEALLNTQRRVNQITSDTGFVKGVVHTYHFVPLQMGGGSGRTHIPTADSSALIDEMGGLPALEEMTSSFYEKAFRDITLDKFIRSHDEPHATRFARWIHQKLSNSTVWDDERASRSTEPVQVANRQTIVVHDRSSAHVAAWNSPKRDRHEVGRHFKLDECRVWMRLHFWAMRECVGDTSPAFTDFYVRFIGHFVRVYEGSAPAFARDSYRWSEDPRNIKDYLDNGHRMVDVLGLSLGHALGQIPENEASDIVWPYV